MSLTLGGKTQNVSGMAQAVRLVEESFHDVSGEGSALLILLPRLRGIVFQTVKLALFQSRSFFRSLSHTKSSGR